MYKTRSPFPCQGGDCLNVRKTQSNMSSPWRCAAKSVVTFWLRSSQPEL